jgi:hypothetical protein
MADCETNSTDGNSFVPVQNTITPAILLGLPREIRDQIYAVMFLRSSPIQPGIEYSRTPSSVRKSIYKSVHLSKHLNLLRVSQQTYTECILVLYGRNKFEITCRSSAFLELVGCLRRSDRRYSLRDAIRTPPLEPGQAVCLARYHLRRLYVNACSLTLPDLLHLVSYIDCFPNLKYSKWLT